MDFRDNKRVIPVVCFGLAIACSVLLFNAVQNQKLLEDAPKKKKVLILVGTTTGTATSLANGLLEKLSSGNLDARVVNMKDYSPEDKLHLEEYVIVVCSTWSEGRPPESASYFFESLKDLSCDFRVSKSLLSKVKFAGFGLGGKVYSPHFCTPMIEFYSHMIELGATQFVSLSLGDDASNLSSKFETWGNSVVGHLIPALAQAPKLVEKKKKVQRPKFSSNALSTAKTSGKAPRESTKESSAGSSGCCQEKDGASKGGCGCKEEAEEEEEDRINNRYVTMDHVEEGEESEEEEGGCGPGCGSGPTDDNATVDLEDLVAKNTKAVKKTTPLSAAAKKQNEMVTSLQRKSLTKEGYRIIGSHSAVKMCRWTKNQMRGRGGCYKHSFYGITSYQCMETTPSLACANKCVFCWRHHKNPVGTEWRWKTDEPDFIVSESIALHRTMVNEMRGVPNVIPARLEEAFTVKHCALSLVGEPIMYPRINEMVRGLHERKISTFLVTNGQFPESIENLEPVTQLYVSIDAASREALKAIDRPLFKDFWERYMQSLKLMKAKIQRTVYRMTLVKSWNMDEVAQYAELIEYGLPDFIEIKAVTYCGKSDASSLTMENVPWHHEVCAYAEAICAKIKQRGGEVPYGLATEHAHSCCILIAREDKFKIPRRATSATKTVENSDERVWHTWIDYPKFETLIEDYYASNRANTFTSEDYMVETPEWAVYNNEAHGFDPVENRWKRNKQGQLVEREYKSTDSGCG